MFYTIGGTSMPRMEQSDFKGTLPSNYLDLLNFINNLILYHEESVFWSASDAETDEWERNLINRYLSGDRTGELQGAPDPIY